ncbi:MAG: flagellar basal body-associated FliL family protein [Parvularculaceae bacterium]|nr:flagellar basal body-associated FliL family protein [Parvularculaceae bacterium]
MAAQKKPLTEDAPTGDAPALAPKSRLFSTALAAAACCGAAGAASYFFAPAALFSTLEAESAATPEAASPSEAVEKKPEDDKRADKKEKKSGYNKKDDTKTDDAREAGATAFFVRDSTGVFALRPIVVTLKPQGRIRYLKIILAIETTPESEHAFMEGELRIIDILTSYLRAVPVSALEDPAAMARIREQIARRVAFVVDSAPVNAILITDFILS